MGVLAARETRRDASSRAIADGEADAGADLDVLFVLAALTAAAIGKGGYYRRVSDVCAVLLALAGAAVIARHRLSIARIGGWVLASLSVMVGGTAFTGVVDGHPRAALGVIAVLVGFAVIVIVVAAATAAARVRMVDTILALGALVATTGWIGVAFRIEPLGHPDGGLWRAATTITYANGAAAVLGPLALWAVARATTDGRRVTRTTAVLLIAGLGATLSRAGLAAFCVGLIVVLALLGVVVWRSVGMLLFGGFVATAGLVPGMATTSSAKPVVALAGLGAGITIGLLTSPTADNRRAHAPNGGDRARIGWLTALGCLAVAVAMVVVGGHSHAWSGRVSLSSPDRAALAAVAMHTWHSHFLSGVGPGWATFTWSTADHRLLFDRYAHNEYLQLAVEQGVLGLIGLAALFAGVVATAFSGWKSGARARRASRRDAELTAIRAGAIAGLVCVACHSAFDFVWHVPIVVMIAAVAVGLSSRVSDTEVHIQPAEHSQPREKESS